MMRSLLVALIFAATAVVFPARARADNTDATVSAPASAGPCEIRRPAATQVRNSGRRTNSSNRLPTGRRYYNGRYYGNFNNRYYGPQYGYF